MPVIDEQSGTGCEDRTGTAPAAGAADARDSARTGAIRNGGAACFTVMVLLLVMGMIGVITALAYPKMHSMFDSANVRTARDRVQAYLNSARAVAVQNGRTSVFHSTAQVIWVTADSQGTQTTYLNKIALNTVYGVTMTATADSVVYTGHGIAMSLGHNDTLSLSKNGKTQQVCIGGLGTISIGTCP